LRETGQHVYYFREQSRADGDAPRIDETITDTPSAESADFTPKSQPEQQAEIAEIAAGSRTAVIATSQNSHGTPLRPAAATSLMTPMLNSLAATFLSIFRRAEAAAGWHYID